MLLDLIHVYKIGSSAKKDQEKGRKESLPRWRHVAAQAKKSCIRIKSYQGDGSSHVTLSPAMEKSRETNLHAFFIQSSLSLMQLLSS